MLYGESYNHTAEWEKTHMSEDVNLFIYSHKVKKNIYCRDGNSAFLQIHSRDCLLLFIAVLSKSLGGFFFNIANYCYVCSKVG